MSFAPITTTRLVLRRLGVADAATVARYRADPAIARYQSWQPADADPDRLASWFAQHAASEPGDRDSAGLLVAITLRAGGALIGDCTLRIHGDQPHTAEIGYSLAPAYHHQGYATEAIGAMCRWALALPAIGRVVAVTDVRNRPSIGVLERVGMARIACVETKLHGEPTHALWYQLTEAGLAERDRARAAAAGPVSGGRP
ncbi:MAG TPA: GNAT family N-acetyltransferase [Kofleriaceae bacterium]|nr:GNAT family N-acetyltransferase [Kofleriaceae bacterium]